MPREILPDLPNRNVWEVRYATENYGRTIAHSAGYATEESALDFIAWMHRAEPWLYWIELWHVVETHKGPGWYRP